MHGQQKALISFAVDVPEQVTDPNGVSHDMNASILANALVGYIVQETLGRAQELLGVPPEAMDLSFNIVPYVNDGRTQGLAVLAQATTKQQVLTPVDLPGLLPTIPTARR